MRDPTILVWPDILFRPAQASQTIDRPLFKGPKPLSGREQVVASDGGGWALTYDGIPVYGSNYSAWRQLWLKIAALGQPVYVAPDLISGVPSPTLTTFSDTTLFNNGSTINNSAFSSSDWVDSYSVKSASPDTMPDGTVTGTILTDDSAVVTEDVFMRWPVPADTKTRTFLFYLKKTGSTPTNLPVVGVFYTDEIYSVFNSIDVAIDPFTGNTTNVYGITPALTSVVSVGSFWKIKLSVTNIGSTSYSYLGVSVAPSKVAAASPTVVNVALTGSTTVWGPQLIEDSTATANFAQKTGDCSLAAAATQGSRTISVTNSIVRARSVGDWFELDGRAHIIQDISGTTWTIWPSLRANYDSGTVLEIDDPRVLCYLTPDSKASVMNTDARQLTLMSLDFVEANW